jgi:hypothetical protein
VIIEDIPLVFVTTLTMMCDENEVKEAWQLQLQLGASA